MKASQQHAHSSRHILIGQRPGGLQAIACTQRASGLVRAGIFKVITSPSAGLAGTYVSGDMHRPGACTGRPAGNSDIGLYVIISHTRCTNQGFSGGPCTERPAGGGGARCA